MDQLSIATLMALQETFDVSGNGRSQTHDTADMSLPRRPLKNKGTRRYPTALAITAVPSRRLAVRQSPTRLPESSNSTRRRIAAQDRNHIRRVMTGRALTW
jgi:hypothetical protein